MSSVGTERIPLPKIRLSPHQTSICQKCLILVLETEETRSTNLHCMLYAMCIVHQMRKPTCINVRAYIWLING